MTAIGLVPQRLVASVAGSLGLVGLVLAAIGIYGVTAYTVSRRTREIGIRVALGADQARVLRLVLRQGLILAVHRRRDRRRPRRHRLDRSSRACSTASAASIRSRSPAPASSSPSSR